MTDFSSGRTVSTISTSPIGSGKCRPSETLTFGVEHLRYVQVFLSDVEGEVQIAQSVFLDDEGRKNAFDCLCRVRRLTFVSLL